MYEDAIGRPMKVGDVIVHASVRHSTIRFHEGVVRELLEDGSIRWDLATNKWGKETNWEHVPLFRRATIYRTEYCIITGGTEEDLKKKYNMMY